MLMEAVMLKRVTKKHIWIFTGVLLLVLIACLQVVYKYLMDSEQRKVFLPDYETQMENN